MAEVVDEIAARLQQGERVDVEEYVGQYPQWAEPLRRLVPALEALAVTGRAKGSEFGVQGSGSENAESPSSPLTPALSRREREHDGGFSSVIQNPKSKIQNRTCLDDFELIREVGRGGMGIVYEARQRSLARRVAVKVLPAACLLDPRQLQRFQNEARAAAQLNHPHIVDVICVGCDGGVHYFAMRFVEGRTLAEVIREEGSGFRTGKGRRQKAETEIAKTPDLKPKTSHTNPKSKIQNPKFANWIAQAAEALDHAHASGIVHRDVKPSNLLIDREGKLWVTDFGLARFGDDAALTMTGDLLGTLRYMSPEQALGQRAAIDHRSDIYSLGATLYELLAGVPVFEGVDRSDLLRQLVFGQPRPLRKLDPGIPRDLETIALKALEKSRGDRYATAGEMAADLRRFIRGEPIRAKPPTAAQRTVKWCLRHRRLVAAAALLLVLAVVGLSVSTVLIAHSSNAARVAQKAAEDRDRENRRMLSAIETRLALQAYQGGNLQRTRELLDRQVPGSGIRENSGSEHQDSGIRENSGAGDRPTSHEAGYGDGSREDLRDFTWHWLRSMIDRKCPELRSFDDYPSEVYEIDFSPDGKLLAAACHRKIIIRDMQSGNVVYQIAAHKSDVNSLDFSPDGTLLASVGDDHHVRLWHVATGELAADLGEHDCQATAVGFSPDGSRLVSGDERGTVRIWDVALRRQERILKEHTGKIDGAVFADRNTLIIDSGDFFMSGWDVDSGRARWKVAAPQTSFMSTAVSPDGATVAAGDHVGTVGLWNVRDGRSLGAVGARKTLIQSVAFSPDSKLLAVGGHDGVTQIWDVAAQSYRGETAPHRERVWSVVFSPDGHTLATSSRDRSVKLWDVAARFQPKRIAVDYAGLRFAFSDLDQSLMLCHKDRLWHVPRGATEAAILTRSDWRLGPPAAWTRGKWLAPDAEGQIVHVQEGHSPVRVLERGASLVDRLTVSHDGHWLALRGQTTTEIWHLPSQRLHRAYVGLMPVFTSDRKQAVFSTGSSLRLLRCNLDEANGGEEDLGPAPQANALALAPDDRTLAVGNSDSTIDLIDLQTDSRKQLTGHLRGIHDLAFSPDGRTLLSGSADGTLRLWRVDVAEPLGILETRVDGDIQQIAFSPDGRTLAAAGRDGAGGAVSVWEIEPPDRPESELAIVED